MEFFWGEARTCIAYRKLYFVTLFKTLNINFTIGRRVSDSIIQKVVDGTFQ